MQKNNTSKAKSSSSQVRCKRTSDSQDDEPVRYEIINTSTIENVRPVEKTNPEQDDDHDKITKLRGSAKTKSNNLDGEGKRNTAGKNESAFGLFKRKFKRKSSKSSKKTEQSASNFEQTSANCNSSSAFGFLSRDSKLDAARTEHVYDVPCIEPSVGEKNDKVEHVYENGHILAGNNEGIYQNTSDTEGGNASVGMEGRRKRQEMWHQGKSNSLPVPRVSKQPPIKPPIAKSPAEPYLGMSHDHESDDSGNESNEDVLEPLSTTKSGSNGSSGQLLRSRSLPMAPKLNYNRQFLDGLNELCKCGWYWGPLTSKEAEVMLRGTPNGTFLVRDSNDNRYLLSLTFRSEKRTLHTRIEFCKGKFSFYAAPFITSGCHESIVDLIEDCVEQSKDKVFCYSKGHGNQGAAFPVRLVKAVSRFERVCTLQHLCRFVIRQHYSLENISTMPLPGMMIRYLNKNHFDTTKQG